MLPKHLIDVSTCFKNFSHKKFKVQPASNAKQINIECIFHAIQSCLLSLTFFCCGKFLKFVQTSIGMFRSFLKLFGYFYIFLELNLILEAFRVFSLALNISISTIYILDFFGFLDVFCGLKILSSIYCIFKLKRTKTTSNVDEGNLNG